MKNEKIETDSFLSVKDLVVEYTMEGEVVHAVSSVSFHLERGKTLALVGETGAGKTSIAKAILRVLPDPPARVPSGSVYLEGVDLLQLKEDEMRKVRGNRISMIFQDPMTALNPVKRVGEQIAEGIRQHQKISRAEALNRACDMLNMVGISDDRVNDYPHQFSGGMKQRVVIAMALACSPDLLLADEPTTALDVTIQAQIMDLILELKEEMGMAVLLITHDMGLVAQMADRVLVMYAGQLIEQARVLELFDHPAHPYTRALLRSVPGIRDEEGRRLESIEGIVPEHYDQIRGCRFARRCPFRTEICMKPQQEMSVGDSHIVRCCRTKEVLADG